LAGSLVVLTGASGTGKTTIALEVERAYPEFAVFRFDAIGVPSTEGMASFGTGHRPGGAWQRAMTLQWFERIAPVLEAGRSVLFEGQMRIAFVTEALTVHAISHAHVILVECDDTTRNGRLVHDRKQPELANESMHGWSRYLHNEAMEAEFEILDTTGKPLAESVAHVVAYLRS
jgi:predicted kinase